MIVAKVVAAWVGFNALLGLYLVCRFFWDEWRDRLWIRRFDRRARRLLDEAQGRKRVGL